MNRMIIYVMLLILSVNCTSLKPEKDSKEEQNIEKLLLIHREYAFIDLYRKSLDKIRKEKGVVIEDFLVDISASELYHEYCLVVDFYSDNHQSYENKNYENLISKWVEKTYYPYTAMDNPNLIGHMTFRKTFDFYYSDDLVNYIDSLRTVFRAKHKIGELQSLKCLEEQERIKKNQ
ncbi:hypothetical protein HX057_02820 [Myroides odoratimimus]|nr:MULTISPECIES: hypothetical protein [Myroides]MCS7471964.1 hypothetical protein [Myroides odoratimimus]MDM1038676.1 hypothetical protein [Myroides odoratimimus]MDM1052882.1 hypothetical protein [Myroides odoratimimus]MDM1413384.1 hypothetical protein [Myroides odoratimimus]MDM1445679.1 hypothetical protein [Myroides odoratimimus]